MRSLFAKIVLWFVATALLTGVGFLLTSALTSSETRGRRMPFQIMLAFQLREARHAWESGGREALRATLERFERGGRVDLIFTDAEGRELVSGADRSAMVEAARRRRMPVMAGGRVVIARQDEDNRYWLFALVPRTNWLGWFLHPHYLWILGLVVLLCHLLALHLTSPVRRLRKAVERFGRGDLSARAATDAETAQRGDELGELAREFDRMAERIQGLLDSQRRLLLDISHELRSPLSRLNVAVELARSGDNQEQALDRIQKEADRLNKLVSELLQVTRAEADPNALHRQPVRLDELARGVVEDCRIEAEARGASLELQISTPATVPGDAELLRRAVENVLRNAIRYAPPGSPVEVAVEANRVRVRDHGPGVPEEQLERIFEPFYRVESDRGRLTGGVGLGLAIARRAVELHKGGIRAQNARPGLLLEIELPV